MLKNTPLFSDISDDELKILQKVAVLKTFPKNTILFSEGDPSDSFYVVNKGKVNVGINDEEGREIILSMLGPGEYFGEMALLDGEPRCAFVMTKEKTQLFIISKKDFQTMLISNPEIMFNLLKGLQKRLREANRKIESLALMNVFGRVARLLTQLAGSKEEEIVITDKLTHQDIANMVGASREMVSRVLKDLANKGYISILKKRITIHKKLPYDW
ncbi:Transcriptional regulator, Crp-type [Desulfonema limicola]|uniref:Transcriptional regulator, Crp-type n=1 Tax=Desulfonema limicola TaxID=45656 RepID=A0A975B3C8_9BACT|nr:Crp/Fnr family transcriptional regulator [Desulfonema limicola]QTA78021.1 Transcriptional regulator, Crp-type [Desulfonema limicola]